ncbi:aldehyde dehydrogenase family protein [Pseudomonas sp. ISL-88]|uniref:aldehyde dehydrogenase family protein n=1 Tax=Pseudomonas sp. ISL-88 TaxID=2819169 RepID=UPI001BED2862|nr:aldehyde dehydrogenase family protein [Pseudomonas sp. ISL-88]MBT2634111.1 aldehyde dehydrogenase family protein [Bacillus sp. ISL-26]MBT2713679.1 aldehyde dehydrogenase family protein [Pseudomonas sp. ISL-88]
MNQFQNANKSFINGAWTEGETGKTIDTVNPFDRSVITTLSLASAKQLEDAFDIAAKSQKEWAKSSAEERKAVLTKAKDYLQLNREDIILTISRETGGTIIKANIELDAAIAILTEAITYTGELGGIREVPSEIEGKINHIYQLPLGVISSISPSNFPLNLSMRTIAPAIALGNSVVHKPDVQTALSGGSIIAKAFGDVSETRGW